jgi:hypothetical protein
MMLVRPTGLVEKVASRVAKLLVAILGVTKSRFFK